MSYFETRGLAVGYNGQVLIHDIDISIEKGKILTLIGPNGAGKSTILKSITRHLQKIGGEVSIGGRDVYRWAAREMARQVAVVLTDRIRPELMTCGEVVAAGRYPYTNALGRLTAADREIVRQSLERVHALELEDRQYLALVPLFDETQAEEALEDSGELVILRRSSSWTSPPPIWTSATRSNCWTSSGRWPGRRASPWS